MGPEVLIAATAVLVGLFSWSHDRRQNVLNTRFESIKRKVDDIDTKVSELPKTYVLKSDLNNDLSEIRTRLSNINDKLDQLIMSKL